MRERRNLTDMINQVRNKEREAKQRAREARSAMRERRNLTDMINQVRKEEGGQAEGQGGQICHKREKEPHRHDQPGEERRGRTSRGPGRPGLP